MRLQGNREGRAAASEEASRCELIECWKPSAFLLTSPLSEAQSGLSNQEPKPGDSVNTVHKA